MTSYAAFKRQTELERGNITNSTNSTNPAHGLFTHGAAHGLFTHGASQSSAELYYSLMGDNFKDLSIDDKLLVMYKTSILRSDTTNNYILMCLVVLVIIAVKLHSK